MDPTCQYPTIFYRGDRFEVEESSEFWLSETPQVHRSLSWGSAFPRMVTYGRFREKGRATSFYFIDTHLDHVSEAARREGARMIREFFLPLHLPLILVGDFNEPPDETVYREFIEADSPLQDTWRQVQPPGRRGHHPARVRRPAPGQPHRLDSGDPALCGAAGGHSHG